VIARAAQHAHPADRFAREIAAILKSDTARSRRLMRNTLARHFDACTICELMTCAYACATLRDVHVGTYAIVGSLISERLSVLGFSTTTSY
jgi:hypothetical protein